MSIYGVSGSSSSNMAEMLAQLRNAKQQDSGGFATSFIADHDTDEDSLLSMSETDFGEEQFSAIDSDGDGYLSADELTAEEQRRQEMGAFNMGMRQPPSGGDMAASLITELDNDGDGSLSQTELEMVDELFSMLDTDGDGTLSAEEIAEDMQSRMDEMQQTAMNMGAMPPPSEDNASGTASAFESSSGNSEEEYDDLDLNKDGTVSFDELRQAMMSGMLGENAASELLGNSTGQSETGSGQVPGFMRRMADQAYQAQMANAGSTTAADL
ncbi:EF-hand domain-containing protein [Desulfovibrio mangrovi]|uniref:EF-hand domain-containing protein n=1 Tax=Desulfovibrio mangrovi TaxID=2976983 RepID=UPI00224850AD|nr:EF-hand domain-containing protein [Desulfovibrio mangrovi]UZP68692.1 EF-hand domain-containing protein [Desulfovibrio mangrovi]